MSRLCVVFLTLWLTACNWIPGDLPLLQIKPAELGAGRTAEQRLQLVWRGEARTLESVLDVSADSLQFIGTAMGLRLFSLDYDGHRIEQGLGAGLPAALPPERIMNDMLLIYAPEKDLRAALPAGWRLEIQQNSRLLMHGDDPVIEVIYHAAAPWRGRTILRHLQFSYQLTVDSVNVS